MLRHCTVSCSPAESNKQLLKYFCPRILSSYQHIFSYYYQLIQLIGKKGAATHYNKQQIYTTRHGVLATQCNQTYFHKTKLFSMINYRARNNFRIGSSHDVRPNSFLLGHVSFLAGQMYNYDELLFYITHVAD